MLENKEASRTAFREALPGLAFAIFTIATSIGLMFWLLYGMEGGGASQ